MQTVTLEVTVPREVLSLGLNSDEVSRQLGRWLVFTLFRDARISSGRAAKLLGLTRRGFLEWLHGEGLSYFDYSAEEMQSELKSVRELPLAETDA